MAVTIHQLLKTVVERGGESLCLAVNTPAQIRIDGDLVPLDLPPLSVIEMEQLAESLLLDREKTRLRDGQLVMRDVQIKGLARFRIAAYHDVKGAVLVAKQLPWEILGYKELGLQDGIFEPLLSGLTLIGGMPGSGRSTVAAAVIDKINRECHWRIMTVSAGNWLPLHAHKCSLVEQLVLGSDGLQPDQVVQAVVHGSTEVVLFDEIYDIAAVRLAIRLAQVGVRVAMVVPGRSARHVVEGLISLFPPFLHPTLQAELSHILRCVTSQRLLRKANGKGRVMAMEVCDFAIDTPRIALEKGQMAVIDSFVTKAERSLEHSLAMLHQKKLISTEMARAAANNVDTLNNLIDRTAQRRGAQASR